jgi:CBS-domain-containing membrane protein
MSDKLHTCSQNDSLQHIFERFAEVKFQTLVCVDAQQRCTGVVAIGDLVAYFID